MNIGLLNCVIILEKNVILEDEIGNHKNEWVEDFVCHATVGGEGGNEEESAGGGWEVAKLTFTVRYSSETLSVTPTSHRIRFGEDIYNILSVDHMNYKRSCLKYRCQRVRDKDG